MKFKLNVNNVRKVLLMLILEVVAIYAQNILIALVKKEVPKVIQTVKLMMNS